MLRQDKRSFDIKAVMREAYFIPETKDVDELLAEFKRGNIQMAIVRDEYGGTAGLVTVEDLLEEIVGEIRDEYDIEEPLIEVIDEDHAIVSARMSIDDLNEQMDLDIPESEEYETIGGFVFDLFGRQPNEGETISYQQHGLHGAEGRGRPAAHDRRHAHRPARRARRRRLQRQREIEVQWAQWDEWKAIR